MQDFAAEGFAVLPQRLPAKYMATYGILAKNSKIPARTKQKLLT
jgi:hypothetical protein